MNHLFIDKKVVLILTLIIKK